MTSNSSRPPTPAEIEARIPGSFLVKPGFESLRWIDSIMDERSIMAADLILDLADRIREERAGIGEPK